MTVWDNYFRFNGANGSSTLTNSGTGGAVATSDGALISTTESISGGASLYLPGDGTNYAHLNTHASLDFGAGDFGFEFGFYIDADSAPTAGNRTACLLSQWTSGSVIGGYDIFIGGDASVTGTSLTFTTRDATNTASKQLQYTGTISKNVYHCLFVGKSGSTYYMALDGVMLSFTTTDSGGGYSETNTFSRQTNLGLTLYPANAHALNGYIDEFRTIKGSCPYTANYSPWALEGSGSISDGADTISASGQVGKVTATASIQESADLFVSNGVLSNVLDISGDLPALTGSVVAYNAGDIISGSLPSLIGYAYAADYISGSLPSLTGSATAYTSAMAYIDGALPMFVFDGQIMATEILYANSTLPMLTGYAYTGDNIIGTLPALVGDAAIEPGTSAIVEGILPSLIGDAQATSIATLRAASMLPMLISGSDLAVQAVLPMLVGFAEVEGQEVALYEAYSINLKHNSDTFVNEVTHYPDYAGFEQIVRFGNDYFARTPTGLFKIGGDTDNHKDINSSIQTGYEDLGTRNYKTVKSVYVGGKMDPGFCVSIIASEDADKPRVYDNQTSRDKLPRNSRVIPGAGIRSSYVAYGISNNYGGKLDIDRVELEVFISNQRSV